MASTINASTTAGIVTTADTSGVLKLQTANTDAVTIDASQVVTFAKQPAGTFAGTGPAFSAGLTGTQSVTSGTYNKITINTKDFDTNSAFNNTGSTVGTAPSYSFNPQVAGYYQVNASVAPNGTSVSSVVAAIYKNGSIWKYGPYIQATNPNSNVSCIVYLNGSTDYIELWAYQTASVASWGAGVQSTYFQASMVRSA